MKKLVVLAILFSSSVVFAGTAAPVNKDNCEYIQRSRWTCNAIKHDKNGNYVGKTVYKRSPISCQMVPDLSNPGEEMARVKGVYSLSPIISGTHYTYDAWMMGAGSSDEISMGYVFSNYTVDVGCRRR